MRLTPCVTSSGISQVGRKIPRSVPGGNPDPWDCEAQTGIPCHRVVFKDGRLAPGFAFGGLDEQRARLEAEGVAFTDDGRVDMGVCQWDGRAETAGGNDGALRGPAAPPADFDWEAELGE